MKVVDPIERVIRPIVEGQIRGFLKEHPSLVEAVDWYKPSNDKATTLINSLSKRIVRDLVCQMGRARLAAAILESTPETQPKSPVASASAATDGPPGTCAGRADATSERPPA